MVISLGAVARGCSAAFVLFLLLVAPASGETLPDPIEDGLVQAARPGSLVSPVLATILAIDDRPDLVSAIVERSVGLSPDKAADIAGATARAFPSFAPQIVAAARRTAADRTAAIDAATEGWPKVNEATPIPTPAAESLGTDDWEAEIEAGGARTTGNTRTESVNLGLIVTHESDDWENRLKSDFNLSRTDDQTDARRFETELKGRNNFSERVYVFGLVDYLDDAFSGYEYQISQNAGLGYQVFDHPDLEWDVETGPGFRVNKIEESGASETEVTWRVAEIFRWDVSETAELSNETSMTFGRETTITESETALTTDITDTIAARLSFEVRNNSSPPTGRKSTDTTTKAAIVYDLVE